DSSRGAGVIRQTGPGRAVDMPATGEAWRVVRSDAVAPSGGPVTFEVRGQTPGAEYAIRIRAARVIDLVTAAGAGPRYRMALKGVPVMFAMRGDAVQLRDGEGDWPRNWRGGTWDPGSLGEIHFQDVEGRLAISMRNRGGRPSIQVFTENPVLTAEAGKRYAVRIRYMAIRGASGSLRLRPAGSNTDRFVI